MGYMRHHATPTSIMTDEQLKSALDRAYARRDVWKRSYEATGSYTSLCNMEDQEHVIEKLETERLKREGALA